MVCKRSGRRPTLVVAIANITALVTRVRPTVDKALGIVDVTITSSTPRGGGVRRISHVDEDQSSPAGQVVPVPHGLVATDGPSSNGIPELLVHDNVVRPPDGQLVKVAREVLLGEDGRAVRVQVEQLLHVEDLHAVLDGLGADNDQVAEGPDFPPPRADGVVLREAAEVDQLALRGYLGEGGPVVLADGDELAPVLGRPSPRGGPEALGASEVCMGEEVVQVDL